MSVDLVGPALRLSSTEGRTHLTGLQALARVPIEVRRRDVASGRRTAAFVSGYEGSPLAGYDLLLMQHGPLLEQWDVLHRPAVNEELAATAVHGSQLVPTYEGRSVDGVTGYWYGKSPGLDRASDALRHGNLAGAHHAGGAVVLVGDDPAAKSSTVPGASEFLLADLGMPILYPMDSQDVLDLGAHAVWMSRASGLWVSVKVATAVADGSGSVTLAELEEPVRPEARGADHAHVPTGKFLQPVLGELESTRNGVRLDVARAYARANHLNRQSGARHGRRVGIIAPGKTYLDVCQALLAMGLDDEARESAGLSLLHLRMVHPLDPAEIRDFCAGLDVVVVVEEKRSFVEAAVKTILFNQPERPLVLGKLDRDDAVLVPDVGELDPDTIAAALARELRRAGGFPAVEAWQARREVAAPRRLLPLAVMRTPYFCSGCPHNRSVAVPEDALVGGGIGCHGMVLLMDEDQVGSVTGLTQMGGEGAQWIGMAPFLRDQKHLIQNLGDGTFHHSGSLAIRAAVAADVNITYKLLYNSAVAMTGGQQATGLMTVPDICRALLAEGVKRVVVTTEDPKRYRGVRLPKGVDVLHRDELVATQTALAAVAGVTVLIHDQECATELRRKRKRGLVPEPDARVVINERICEGCGDCGQKSNCLSVLPVDTEFGRKTRIDQSSCNKDYSCLDGDCPSFMSVTGSTQAAAADLREVSAAELPEPTARPTDRGHHTTRILGVGGSGVVTLSQILSVAAGLAGRRVRTLDQTGLAQKGGAVVSDIKVGDDEAEISNKAAAAEVDLYLGADILVAADPRFLAATHGGTTAVVSTAEVPTGQMVVDPSRGFPDSGSLVSQIRSATGGDGFFLDARRLSVRLFGSDQYANVLLTGVAYQLGALPVPAEAIEDAIRLNGAKAEVNVQAFRRGRLAVADPGSVPTSGRVDQAAAEDPRVRPLVAGLQLPAGGTTETVVRRRVDELIAYQDLRYAQRYVEVVARVKAAEDAAGADGLELTEAVAHHLHKLMAYKDEYEVARLAVDPSVLAGVHDEYGPDAKIHYRLHPPVLRALGMRNKISLGPWFRPVFRFLAASRRLRGTAIDPFGRAEVRRVERALVGEYVAVVDALLPTLGTLDRAACLELASLPDLVRGYEDVKLASVERYRVRMRELTHELMVLPASS